VDQYFGLEEGDR